MMKRIMYSLAVLAVAVCVGAPVHIIAAQTKPAAKAPAKAAAAKAGAARTVNLEGIDAMKFVPATIEAKPGETLHVVLKSTTTMPKIAMAHNFVLLKPGIDVTSFVNESMKARLTNYVPDSRKADVIAATSLAGKGETVDVTFTVPKKPGTYTFICTFPGHFAGGMKGTLIVK